MAEAEAESDRSKPQVRVGTIGHEGQGKTTLTRALQKILGPANVEDPSVKSD